MRTETALTTTRPVTAEKEPGYVCEHPYIRPSYPTHHLIRGTLRWLERQAQDALQNPQHQWHGCYHEYQQLINGAHPDTNPGAIITPDNPQAFHPDQINIAPDADLPWEDLELNNIQTNIQLIDQYAWTLYKRENYANNSQEKVPYHSALFDRYCLTELRREIQVHEDEIKHRQKEDIPYK